VCCADIRAANPLSSGGTLTNDGLTALRPCALPLVGITEELSERARKLGLTDQEAIELVEVWKQAAKRTKYLKVAIRAKNPPNSDSSVGL
jgi:hypothetical protein